MRGDTGDVEPYPLDDAYLERVAAGVVGRIASARLGDGGVTAAFTVVGALAEHPTGLDITPAEFGRTWLNHLIPGRTILAWGGLGVDPGHTAQLRMERGVLPPRSGSAALGSRALAEQADVLHSVDLLGFVVPGEPVRAADLARRAAAVAHDGEAVHAAAALAAMVAEAFADPDVDHLLDTASAAVPAGSEIAAVVAAVRALAADAAGPLAPDTARVWVAERFPSDPVRGDGHVVPTFARILIGMLGDIGADSLAALAAVGGDAIAAGALGTLRGIRLGLPPLGSPAADARAAAADRIMLPTADGARAVTDAAREAVRIVGIARTLRGEDAAPPKGGARYPFALPGALHGFTVRTGAADAAVMSTWSDAARANVLHIHGTVSDETDLLVATPTFVEPAVRASAPREALAVPTLYAGQRVTARVARTADADGVLAAALALAILDEDDELRWFSGPATPLGGTAFIQLAADVPPTGGSPIAAVGIRVIGEGRARLEVDRIDSGGVPALTLGRAPGTMWARAWVDAVSRFDTAHPAAALRPIQNDGTGIVTTGADWGDLRVEADVRVPVARAAGLAARTAGQHRYKALTVSDDGLARLVLREHEWEEVFASLPIEWRQDAPYALALEVAGDTVRGWVDGELVGEVDIPAGPAAGGIGLLVTEGVAQTDEVRIRPLR